MLISNYSSPPSYVYRDILKRFVWGKVSWAFFPSGLSTVEGALDPNISFSLSFLGKIYFLRLNKELRVERFIDSSFHGEQSSFQFASHLDIPRRRCQVNPPLPRLNVWIGYYFEITCFTFLPAAPKKAAPPVSSGGLTPLQFSLLIQICLEKL